MSWWSEYSEIPFVDHGRDRSGCDCYGLVRLVFSEQLGIELPGHCGGYESTKDRRCLHDLIRASVEGWHQVETPEPFDVLIIRVGGANCHIGVVVATNTVLHTQCQTGVVVEDFTRPHLAPRVKEIWRRNSLS